MGVPRRGTRRARNGAIPLFALLGLGACDDDGHASTGRLGARGGDVEIDDPKHHSLPSCASASLTGDTLRLGGEHCDGDDEAALETILSGVAIGDVVTSSEQGSSFVRRVTEVHCGGRRLVVEPAHLGHVAHANNWDDTHVDALGTQLGTQLQGRLVPTSPFEPITLSTNPMVQITDATFRFEPEFDFELDRNLFEATRFKAQVGGVFSGRASLSIETQAQVGEAEKAVMERLEKTIFSLAPAYELVVVDGVPVATVTTVSFHVSAALEGDFDAKLNVDVGINEGEQKFMVGPEYDGEWSLDEPNYAALQPYVANAVLDAQGEMTLDVELRASVSVDLYDLIGPEISVIPYGTVHVNGGVDSSSETPGGYHYDLTGGIKGAIGIDASRLGWFGKFLEKSWEFTIWAPTSPLVEDEPLGDGG